jgi:hypothetical protein
MKRADRPVVIANSRGPESLASVVSALGDGASAGTVADAASGAGHVILVIGGQKIVPDLTTALRRIQQYCLPLEDRRAREAYSVPSGVNNILVINRVITPGRITALLVRESLGF